MKNEQTIKSILEAIEKSVDKQINESREAAKKEQLKENAVMDLLNQFMQAWNDATPYTDGDQIVSGGMTHGEAFRITLGTILGFGGSFALALTWDKVKAALTQAPGKIKQAFQAFKALKGAKTEGEAKEVMAQFGATQTSVNEARAYAVKQIFEATKGKSLKGDSFKQVSKGEGKGGAKQDNEIKGKKPSEKAPGKEAEDWKKVDPKTATKFGSKPAGKKPQDASKEQFKKVSDGANKAKKIDTDPTYSKVKDGKVKGGAKSNATDVKKK